MHFFVGFYPVFSTLLYKLLVNNTCIRLLYTDLVLITADKLSGGTNIDDLERP